MCHVHQEDFGISFSEKIGNAKPHENIWEGNPIHMKRKTLQSIP